MGSKHIIRKTRAAKESLMSAKGDIKYTLLNDMVFHMVMAKSKTALKGLVCALKGLKESDVRSVKLLNTIDYNEALAKQIALDVRVELNTKELIDIEVQVAKQAGWINRSLLYLCRTFDNLGSGDDYTKIKPATHVGILDFDLFPEHPEFYARYLMTNVKNQNVYTPNFALNVLSLKHINKATAQDKANKLVYWAKLFKATTWEELKKLADQSVAFEEVTSKMYKANTDAQQRYLIEAHEKYMLDMLTEKNARKRAERELRKAKRELKAGKEEIEAKEQEIESQAQKIESKDQEIEAKDQEIARLRKQLAAANR